MITRRDAATAAPRLKTREDWLVSHSNGFKANIIVWVMPKDLAYAHVLSPMVAVRAVRASVTELTVRTVPRARV